ncbi:hypothetical protein GCM10027610_131530 [Dactylosporangium cerinum]
MVRRLEVFTADWRDHDVREERRLAYVAVTRPRRLLLASGYWWGDGVKRARGPSVFLEEIRERCAAGAGLVDVWTEAPASDAQNPTAQNVPSASWPADPLGVRRPLLEAAAALVREAAAALAPPDETAALAPSDEDAADEAAVLAPSDEAGTALGEVTPEAVGPGSAALAPTDEAAAGAPTEETIAALTPSDEAGTALGEVTPEAVGPGSATPEAAGPESGGTGDRLRRRWAYRRRRRSKRVRSRGSGGPMWCRVTARAGGGQPRPSCSWRSGPGSPRSSTPRSRSRCPGTCRCRSWWRCAATRNGWPGRCAGRCRRGRIRTPAGGPRSTTGWSSGSRPSA